VHAFVTSRLDYANALYLGSPQHIIDKLQSVQNAAARLITGHRKFDHITPILHSLHWLPIYQRIKFKVLLFMYKAKHGLAPSYISDLLTIYSPPRDLRSANRELFLVPFTRSTFIKESTFSHAGPKMWNELPEDIRRAQSLTTFKTKLKTYLFKQHFE
jgi:hypothetical protein